ncbi:MAG TPA: hypothetical protein PLJ21_11430 [Pseudobdellovibrionaceae bacterium]|nr:hypothetical protein [Pseudobdellovibrionaceae bacterium]
MFQHYVFSGKDLLTDNRDIYLDSYNLFKNVWESTLKEINGCDFRLFSNDFTRQDRIHALFYGSDCAGLTCLRKINLDNPVDLEDSWLRIWHQNHFDEIKSQSGPESYINSYFTVNQNFRKSLQKNSTPVGYILGCLSFLDQLHIESPTVLGMMRMDRSMHKLGALWGSELIEGSVEYNNTPTDLVVFKKNRVEQASKLFSPIVYELWNQRINFIQEEQNEKHKRAA